MQVDLVAQWERLQYLTDTHTRTMQNNKESKGLP